jgi:hypothetical protein
MLHSHRQAGDSALAASVGIDLATDKRLISVFDIEFPDARPHFRPEGCDQRVSTRVVISLGTCVAFANAHARVGSGPYRDDMVCSTRASAYTMRHDALSWVSRYPVRSRPSVRDDYESTRQLARQSWLWPDLFRTSNREPRLIESRFIACRRGRPPIRSSPTTGQLPPVRKRSTLEYTKCLDTCAAHFQKSRHLVTRRRCRQHTLRRPPLLLDVTAQRRTPKPRSKCEPQATFGPSTSG